MQSIRPRRHISMWKENSDWTTRHSLGPAHPNIINFTVYNFICYFTVLLREGSDFTYYSIVFIRPEMLVHGHTATVENFLPDGTTAYSMRNQFQFYPQENGIFSCWLWNSVAVGTLVDRNRAHPRSSEYGDLFSLITTYFQHGLVHTIINLKWLLSFFRESSARVICKMLCNGALLHLHLPRYTMHLHHLRSFAGLHSAEPRPLECFKFEKLNS